LSPIDAELSIEKRMSILLAVVRVPNGAEPDEEDEEDDPEEEDDDEETSEPSPPELASISSVPVPESPPWT
jgi:hypothetical protein